MTDKVKYVAITIGPIGETLYLVSKPAGLWAASYLFSYITEQLTIEIKKQPGYEILTPYFEFHEEESYQASRGAGFYHDHIIVKNGELQVIESIIRNVKEDLGEKIFSSLQKVNTSVGVNSNDYKESVCSYVNDYIRIYATEKEIWDGTNSIITELAALFDGMELRCQTVPVEKENYIASFLDNKIIKDSFLVKELKKKGNGVWQLFKSSSTDIKDLKEIARNDGDPKKWKRYSYYAYVNSDGDKLGTILSKLKTQEQVRSFSQACLKYNADACRCVEEFGGIVIYAGGDDLRFLAPLTQKRNVDKGQTVTVTLGQAHDDAKQTEYKTIFELILEIKKCFENVFLNSTFIGNETKPKPSISFGMAITYYKYPLYETGITADNLLYEAKECGRDSMCVFMKKDSGQSAKYIIHNLSKCSPDEGILNDLNKVIDARIRGTSMSSVLNHITQYSGILDFAIEQKKEGNTIPLDCFFENIFTGDTALADQSVKNAVKELTADTVNLESNKCPDIESMHGTINTNEGKEIQETIWPIIDLLRTVQLFGEEGDPRHD